MGWLAAGKPLSMLAILFGVGAPRLASGYLAGTALLVVAGIWTLLLIACPPWLRRFRYGPVEGLWRAATSGERQALPAR